MRTRKQCLVDTDSLKVISTFFCISSSQNPRVVIGNKQHSAFLFNESMKSKYYLRWKGKHNGLKLCALSLFRRTVNFFYFLMQSVTKYFKQVIKHNKTAKLHQMYRQCGVYQRTCVPEILAHAKTRQHHIYNWNFASPPCLLKTSFLSTEHEQKNRKTQKDVKQFLLIVHMYLQLGHDVACSQQGHGTSPETGILSWVNV